MPKLSTRTILAVLISLGVVLAIVTSVQGASISVAGKVGSHLVNGAMVNFNHDRYTVSELETYNAQLDAYDNSFYHSGGGGCESDNRTNPNDY